MSTSYSYQTSTSFPSGLNVEKLNSEIILALSREDFYLSLRGSKLVIHFQSVLNIDEETNLVSTISTHNPNYTEEIAEQAVNLEVRVPNVGLLNYQTVTEYLYPGSVHGLKIKSLKLLTTLQGGSSYNVRFVDITNGNELKSGSFSNTTESIISLSNLTNIPTTESVLEIQVKVLTGIVNIKNISLIF